MRTVMSLRYRYDFVAALYLFAHNRDRCVDNVREHTRIQAGNTILVLVGRR